MLFQIKHDESSNSIKSISDLSDNNSTLVLNAKGKSHYWKGAGPLSFKFYRKGKATFKRNKTFNSIDEQSYIVVNNNEEYEVLIDEIQTVESFIIFLNENLINDIYLNINPLNDSSHKSSIDKLLEFRSYSYRKSLRLNQLIENLYWSIRSEENNLRIEERLHFLINEVLNDCMDINKRKDDLVVAKNTTKKELFKRLLIARDFIHSQYIDELTLKRISAESSISVNHLIRNFKRAFGVTPSQYIIDLKLTKAKNLLLREPDKPIMDICFDVGYESQGHFLNTFKAHYGVTPSEFRNLNKI